MLDVHHEYNQLQEDDETDRYDDWFENVGSHVCSFKKKVHFWLRKIAQKAKCSSKYSCISSRSDKGSVNSKESKGSHKSSGSRRSREIKSFKFSTGRQKKRQKCGVDDRR